MKAVILAVFMLGLVPAVQPNAEKEHNLHQTLHEIGELKDRLKALRNLINGINEDSCQSTVTTTVVCDVADKISKTIKCVTSDDEKHRNKASPVDFVRKFNSNPVVTAGLAGLNFFFGADVEVSTQNVQKTSFHQVVKSDNLVAPLAVMSNSFACPSRLQPHN